MEELIQEKLHEIEKRENCRILLAVESGSRVVFLESIPQQGLGLCLTG